MQWNKHVWLCFCILPDFQQELHQNGSRLPQFLSCNQTRGRFKEIQIKTNVQTAHESRNLNMDLVSFDNNFQQLCA